MVLASPPAETGVVLRAPAVSDFLAPTALGFATSKSGHFIQSSVALPSLRSVAAGICDSPECSVRYRSPAPCGRSRTC